GARTPCDSPPKCQQHALAGTSGRRTLGREGARERVEGDPDVCLAPSQAHPGRAALHPALGLCDGAGSRAARPSSLRAAARRGAVGEGNAELACATLREALALWRGPALAEFSAEPFGRSEGARLEELRLSALEARIDADLALGHHADLVGELESLVARHPLRE